MIKTFLLELNTIYRTLHYCRCIWYWSLNFRHHSTYFTQCSSIVLYFLYLASCCALNLRFIDFPFSQNNYLFETQNFLLFWASLRRFYCVYPCSSARLTLWRVFSIYPCRRSIEISVTACGNAPLWRPRRRWDDNIKMDVKDLEWGG